MRGPGPNLNRFRKLPYLDNILKVKDDSPLKRTWGLIMTENKTLASELARLKLDILPQFNKGMIRKGACWFVGREFTIGEHIVQLAWFGNWKEGKAGRGFWQSGGVELLTPDDKAAVTAIIDEEMARERAEREAFQVEVALEAEEMWKQATDRGDHPYITRKKLASLHGTRIYIQEQGHPVLLVPMRDVSGKLWNITRIYTQKFEGTKSDKFIIKGGRKKGLFHLLGEIKSESTVYVTEGFATGASVFEAIGRQPTLVCFDAGNLGPVTQALRETYPSVKFVFCADNDQWTRNASGALYNTGREAALLAASVVRGTVVLPRFTSLQLESSPTDFNDVHCLAGIKAVEEQILNPQPTTGLNKTTLPKNVGLDEFFEGVNPPRLPWHTPKGAKNPSPPKQNTVAECLVLTYGEYLMREKEDVFLWLGHYWKELDPGNFKRFIRAKGQIAMGGQAGDKDLNSYYNMVLDKLRCVPEGMSFYQQLPNVCNFLDGTLHLNQRKKQLEFRKHSPADLLTWVLPHHYTAPRLPNPVFEAWLKRAFDGDPQGSDKIRAMKQLGGACLIPVNPCFGFFHGPAGTGKSTFALLCHAFVGEENLSTLSPDAMRNQKQVETMINKRVNINTDIDGGRVDSGMMKQITDKRGISVNRMYKKTIIARLPLLHLYCGNNLPSGIDGVTDAMDRRVSIIEMLNPLRRGEMTGDYDQEIMEAGSGAILQFFDEGLRDLVESGGFYLNPGIDALHEWKLENDPVGQFLQALTRGEINGLSSQENGCTRQHLVFEAFMKFLDLGKYKGPEITRNRLYKLVRQKGYPTVKVDGYDNFKGIGILGKVESGPGSVDY